MDRLRIGLGSMRFAIIALVVLLLLYLYSDELRRPQGVEIQINVGAARGLTCFVGRTVERVLATGLRGSSLDR